MLDQDRLEEFVVAAACAYRACTPSEPPSCFALLVGELTGDTAVIDSIEFGRNVRASDSVAQEEFQTTIVPCFGTAYRNRHRGFWCDSADLLRIHRAADAHGLELLGSIHLHPDWHRIGPEREHGFRISQAPTPMDAYMFANTGWPVNMICYIDGAHDLLGYQLGTWSPPGADGACPAIETRLRVTV